MKNFTIYFAGIILMTTGCNKDDMEVLLGNWELYAIEEIATGQYMDYPDALTETISMEFTDSGRIFLSGVCNTGSASYSLENGRIRFYAVSLTEMGCVGNNWEEYFYELIHVSEYEVDDNRLTLYSENEYHLYFER